MLCVCPLYQCLQALMLLGSSTWAARMWGVPASSPLWEAASQFLSIRALGSPVTVLLLVMQVNMGSALKQQQQHTSSSLAVIFGCTQCDIWVYTM
jgi:hypothetical protein